MSTPKAVPTTDQLAAAQQALRDVSYELNQQARPPLLALKALLEGGWPEDPHESDSLRVSCEWLVEQALERVSALAEAADDASVKITQERLVPLRHMNWSTQQIVEAAQ